ncbi:hypothetical protein [Herbaspirillum sp. C7C8]|uniref:hypothetical protein n=1 Tax=Herbaspirillum sp. C7C8 TaxID=2736665 RepID=UPI001F5258E7|nr:hypothetical protein [Herbaspirillum sp. C7C8]MCI1005216.1 hypothetical protein [Herbaspirillum sp. C7C8]
MAINAVLGPDGWTVAPIVDPRKIDVSMLRQVSNNCRYPNILFGLRQFFGMSIHKAGADMYGARIGYVNYYGQQEVQGAGTIQIAWALEYPIGRDDLQIFTTDGSEFGAAGPGGETITDWLTFDRVIPKGSDYKLFPFIYSSASGIPGCYSGPQPFVNGASTYGLAIQSGSATTALNYLFNQTTSAQRAALANNGTITSNVQVVPMCILSNTTNKALAICGDSRFAGQNSASPYNFDYVSDASLKQCAGERVFGECAPWINLAASGDSLGNFTVSGGSRRHQFMKFCTDIVNGYGTNDIDGAASDAALQALDTAFASLKYVAGKRLWGVTLPPKGTSSNQMIDLAGQTPSVGDTRRLNLNAWRKSADIYTGGVLDYAAVVSDAATGKFKANGVATTGTMTVGSNSVALGAAVATAEMAGKTAYVTGAGTSAAALIARIQYVDASTIALVDAVTGLAVNCATAVSGVVVYLNCREYSADYLHETQFACQQYEAVLKPVALALFGNS